MLFKRKHKQKILITKPQSSKIPSSLEHTLEKRLSSKNKKRLNRAFFKCKS